ncbi:MAG: CapA family protein [Bacteroidales bacterium]|nr:CapA family protein [Bacteroidales bacterium]
MNVALAGDIALNGLISSDSGTSSMRYGWLAGELGKLAGVIANLETPVVSAERNEGRSAWLFADPAVTLDVLKRLNIICVSLANNHILDCGREGLANTVRLLDEAGIHHAGAGLTPEQAGPALFQTGGRKVAFAAWVHPSTHPAADRYGDIFLNIFDVPEASAQIRSLREEADIVIVSIHWGTDYSFWHEEWQSETARQLIDAGADIIMGHHSHTLQAYERYGHGLIFYGLGSLTFGDFVRNGRQYALFRKTKKTAVFVLGKTGEIKGTISTREKKGNFIVRGRMNVKARNRRLTAINRLRQRSRLARHLLRFQENVLYRIYEYFFGYYMNPAARLVQFGNLRKIKRLLR